ncbi:MAG TPA: hypothetical protein VFE47_08105 [Tepidisphaeraceae bacterium]|jgi:hypothetical protein|nr:hypothetical protein [Tepidisphaeraceae bacterium]
MDARMYRFLIALPVSVALVSIPIATNGDAPRAGIGAVSEAGVRCVVDTGGIRLTISMPRHIKAGGSIPVVIELTNLHKVIARFDGPKIPVISVDGEDGKPVELMPGGILDRVAPETPDVFELKPNESRRDEIDLAKLYHLPDGRYTLSVTTAAAKFDQDDWECLTARVSFAVGHAPQPNLLDGKPADGF